MKIYSFLLCVGISGFVSTVHGGEFSGYIGAQTRNFFEDPLSPEQHNNYLSAVTEPEYIHQNRATAERQV